MIGSRQKLVDVLALFFNASIAYASVVGLGVRLVVTPTMVRLVALSNDFLAAVTTGWHRGRREVVLFGSTPRAELTRNSVVS